MQNVTLIFGDNPQYKVGVLDKLSLKTAFIKNGTDQVEREIKHHTFKTWTSLPFNENLVRSYDPYTLSHVCHRNDGSALSKEVFCRYEMIYGYAMAFVLESNPLNKVHQKDRIDHCTNFTLIDDNTIEVTTKFYDRDSLIAVLEADVS